MFCTWFNKVYFLQYLRLPIIRALPTPPPSPRLVDSKLLIVAAEKTSHISV